MVAATRFLRVLAASSAAVLAASCGSTSPGSSQSASSSSAAANTQPAHKANALLPTSIRKAGVITFGTDISYPPFEYYASNNKTSVGFDIDLAHALAAILGVKVQIEQVNFAELPVELDAGKFDAGISAIGDTSLRHRQANFVDYVKVLGAIIVKRDNSNAPKSLGDLCGSSVAVQTGSDEVTIASAQSHKCVAEGRHAVAIQAYPEEPAQVLAVNSGRAAALIVDTGVGSYLVRQSSGSLRMGQPFGPPSFDGIAVAKSNEQLLRALRVAVQELIHNGQYARLIKKWGFQYNALRAATINAGS